MNRKEAEMVLDSVAGQLVSPLGFNPFRCLAYARLANDATAILSFGGRLDPRGYYAFTLGAGLHFEAVSNWLDDNSSKAPVTVGTPMHFLRGDKSFAEWKFSNAGDLDGLRGAISSDLNNLALPFIDRYSKLPNLREAVESADVEDWIKLGLSQDRRVNVLAAIQMVQGDTRGAMKTLDGALAERRTALPKRRIEIERLRRRLVEAGNAEG